MLTHKISTGETWNLMKIGYQLKQVRERLAKGLVDKGILRTEKRNFLLFDMATHPVTDNTAKDEIRRRVRAVLTNRTVVLPPTPWLPEEMDYRYLRTIAMLCAAYAANVLENALSSLGHEARERAFAQVDEMLAEYSQWPFGKRSGGQAAMGANLDAVIREEIGGSQERELQMEVCFRFFVTWLVSKVGSANILLVTGCCRVLGRVYSSGLFAIKDSFPRLQHNHETNWGARQARVRGDGMNKCTSTSLVSSLDHEIEGQIDWSMQMSLFQDISRRGVYSC